MEKILVLVHKGHGRNRHRVLLGSIQREIKLAEDAWGLTADKIGPFRTVTIKYVEFAGKKWPVETHLFPTRASLAHAEYAEDVDYRPLPTVNLHGSDEVPTDLVEETELTIG